MRLRDLFLRLSQLADIAHVAFDLDGTLVDSRADLARAVSHVRLARGRGAVDARAVPAYVGEGAAILIERALGPSTDEDLAEALVEFLEYYGAHCLDDTRVYPGMHAALDALRSTGRTLSIMTNKPHALAERIVRGLGIRQVFVEIVGGDSPSTRKPDPRGLVATAARAGIPITRTILVGDSPIDFETAAAAGSAFCGAAWGFAPHRLQECRPTWVARDPWHLVELFDACDRRLDSRWSRR